jgi:adenine-specific DNA-methyltransferase
VGKTAASYQKLRGGYYTPKAIADFLAKWAIQSPTSRILEPSCGDGALLVSALQRMVDLGSSISSANELIHGVEIDPIEAQTAIQRLTSLVDLPNYPNIHVGDFFSYCQTHLINHKTFDAVIGNPPFIRYQNFPEEHRAIAFHLMHNAGLRPNRLTNAWVPFLVAATQLLSSHGRLAMVIPAELLQVKYTAELRRFLSDAYNHITLITFKKLVFEGIQQEIVLLLGERNGSKSTGIRTIELEDANDLHVYDHDALIDSPLKEMDHTTEKWTMYFLEKEEIHLLRKLREHPGLTRAGHVLDVDVGVVTGLNEFFVLTAQQVEDLNLSAYTRPLVGRSGHLQGTIFQEADWRTNAENQLPSFLLDAPDQPFEQLPEQLKSYIARGEANGANLGFKCRIRNRWYIVPSVWNPDAFMLRQIHSYPKIVLNQAAATSTDTIHRVRLRNGIPAPMIAAAFLNSLTFAFAEIIGRSYGGGVLELEPNEAEMLPIPLQGAERLDIQYLDTLLRKNDIESVLNITDRVLLAGGLGLGGQDIQLLRSIWKKLRNRRTNRKHR